MREELVAVWKHGFKFLFLFPAKDDLYPVLSPLESWQAGDFFDYKVGYKMMLCGPHD